MPLEPKDFEPGDKVRVYHMYVTYVGFIVGPSPYLAGAWLVNRPIYSKIPGFHEITGYRPETVDPFFITLLSKGENTMRQIQTSDMDIDAEIAELVETVRSCQQQIKDITEELKPTIDAAKERIAELLVVRGSNWKDDQGGAQLIAESENVTWDTKRLEGLIVADPANYGWLSAFRKVGKRKGYVRVD